MLAPRLLSIQKKSTKKAVNTCMQQGVKDAANKQRKLKHDSVWAHTDEEVFE